MTADTTTGGCAGRIGCGGPDCIERPESIGLCEKCGHPADEHSVYGCFDHCGCEKRPGLALRRRNPGSVS